MDEAQAAEAQEDETQLGDVHGSHQAAKVESLSGRISRHPWWVLLVGLATMVGAAFTVMSVFTDWLDDDGRGSGPIPSESPPSSSEAGVVEAETTPGVPGADRPNCLSGDDPSACDQAHDREVFAADACSVDDAVRYFGGIPSKDFLLPGITVGRFDEASCIVDLPEMATTRMEGVLGTRSGDALRWCVLDADLLEPVACDNPHFGEVTYASEPGSTDERNCLSSVEDYLETSLRDARVLIARDATLEGRGSCLVTVTANQVLTASVRNLVGRPVPLG